MVERLFYIGTSGLVGLAERLDELSDVLDDMRPLFEQFASDFYKDEKRIFQLRGRGRYVDLAERTKTVKEKKLGSAYPILFFSGALANSLLKRSGKGSVLQIGKRSFNIGTSIPYGAFHMTGTKYMPRRPLWFLDEGNDPLQRRWARTTEVYLQKALDGAFDDAIHL